MITIPCDYHHPEGTGCEEGRVLIYGEMGGRPPQTIDCPKCKGAGKIEVEESVIEAQIADLVEERQEINQELYRLRRLLFQKRVSEGQKLAWERRKNGPKS
jgi:hypothetical protein